MAKPLLLDIAACTCTDHVLEVMAKSMAEQAAGDAIWSPHHDPYVSRHIEQVTGRLLRLNQAIRDVFEAIAKRGEPSGAPMLKAQPWVRMDDVTLAMIERDLAQKDPKSYTLDDWLLVVDLIINRYLPDNVIQQEAEYLSVRGVFAGRIQAAIEDAGITAAMAEALVRVAPVTVVQAGQVATFSGRQAAVLRFARARAAELIQDVGERVRHRIKDIIIRHEEGRALGLPKTGLWDLQFKLQDELAILNRDWRRVALTEVAEDANQGYIASLPEGTIVRRVEVYETACSFCRKINGIEMEVVSPDRPDKDGWKHVWVGKTNVGRSASPRKRDGDELVERAPDELYYPAAGAQHPNCFVNPNVPIYTSNGWRPISEIKVGDLVLTHLGRFKPVNWIRDDDFLYTGQVSHVRVSFDGRNCVSMPAMTPEHPVLTEQGWIEAGKLVAGDRVVAMEKACPTCGESFINPKFERVAYCSVKCSPKSGRNQFSTDDATAKAEAVEVTREANRRRMARMTIEQRRELTKNARAVMADRGWDHLTSVEAKRKSGIAAARYNYTPRDEERVIASTLEGMGVCVDLQHRIPQGSTDSAGRPRYWWADIALPEHKIAAEVDGEPWHSERIAAGRDERRDADLRSQGWTVLRFSQEDAKKNPTRVAEEIARVAMNHSGDYRFGFLDVEAAWVTNVRSRKLYNFGVEEDESYVIQGGIVVHNCRGSWQKVYSKPEGVDPKFDAWLQEQMASLRPNPRGGP